MCYIYLLNVILLNFYEKKIVYCIDVLAGVCKHDFGSKPECIRNGRFSR